MVVAFEPVGMLGKKGQGVISIRHLMNSWDRRYFVIEGELTLKYYEPPSHFDDDAVPSSVPEMVAQGFKEKGAISLVAVKEVRYADAKQDHDANGKHWGFSITMSSRDGDPGGHGRVYVLSASSSDMRARIISQVEHAITRARAHLAGMPGKAPPSLLVRITGGTAATAAALPVAAQLRAARPAADASAPGDGLPRARTAEAVSCTQACGLKQGCSIM